MAPKNAEEFVYRAVVDGTLEIDPEGRVWRNSKKGRRRAENDPGEYLQVRLMRDGIRVHACASRLVWRHFNGSIPAGLTVNHKNGHKKENAPGNLELASYSEQQIHALHILGVGRVDQNGMKNAMAKVTAEQVAEIRRRRATGEKLRSIAADFGVTYQAVSKIARGSRWASTGQL
jgi:hypothetical protein